MIDVITKALAYRDDLARRERIALTALSVVRAEKQRLADFLDLYAHFSGTTASPDSGAEGCASAADPGTDSQAKASKGNGGSNAPFGGAPVSGDASRLSGGSGTTAIIPEAPKPLPEGEATAAPDIATPAEAKTSDMASSSDDAGGVQGRICEPTPPLSSVVSAPVTRAQRGARIERVRAYFAEHPNATAREAGDALGLDPKHVNQAAKVAGIVVRRLTPAEFTESRREGGRIGGQMNRRPPADDGDRRKYGDPDDMVPLDSISRSVRERIVNRFKQKPNWTAALLAKDLGVRIEVVRTVLAHHQQVAA